MARNDTVSRFLQTIDKVTSWVTSRISGIAAGIVACMMMVIVVDVTLRFLNHPVIGAVEIVKFMLLMVIFLALPNTHYRKSHIAIDLFYNRFSQKVKRYVDIFGDIFSLGIVSLLAWRAIAHFLYFYREGSYVVALKIPLAPFQFILAFGWVLLGFVLLLDCFRTIFRGNAQ
jgi:TRAP-type C4-dicarboxylate transport system permease small subunit